MKTSKIILLSIFAATAFFFIAGCSGGGSKHDEYSDLEDDSDNLDDSDKLPEEDTEPAENSDTEEEDKDQDEDSAPANDNDPSDDPVNDSDREDTDPGRTDEDREQADHDSSEPTDNDEKPDETPDDEIGDEDTIPVSEDSFIVCTGQTECYQKDSTTVMENCPASPNQDFFGQDAQYAKKGYCFDHSFTTSEKVVTDNLTGLIWQRELPKTGCQNTSADGSDGFTICTLQEAVKYCDDLVYADSDEWRLPTPAEFATIKNFGSIPAIDTEKFPLPTDEPIFRTAAAGWTVDFSKGETTKNIADSKPRFVRCVSGKELEKPEFKTLTENGDEIIYNETNNMKWTKIIVDDAGNAKELTWKAALKECEDLEYGDDSADWRLPNINELVSIIDYSRSNPASQFPGLKSVSLWSSTTYAGFYSKAWTVDMSSGIVESSGKGSKLQVICVQ